MIAYIGDISAADAQVLKNAAENYSSILEFGCGASTQVIAKYKKPDVEFISIDTSYEWIEKTKSNLDIFKTTNKVDFYDYNDFMDILSHDTWKNKRFTFVFNDGVDALRRDFAQRIWPYLAEGGILAFHDTKRPHDFRNVLEILAHFQDEIMNVHFNVAGSNMTCIQKKAPEPYDNWQITEHKEPFMLGYGEVPDYYKEIMRKSE